MYFFLLLEQDRAGHMLTQWRAFKSSYLVSSSEVGCDCFWALIILF